MKNYELIVEGMKCGGCTAKVEKALSAMEDVAVFDVSLDDKKVTAKGEALKGMRIKTAIEELGFSVVSLKKKKE